MNPGFFLRPVFHGAMSGASDEALGAVFLILSILAGVYILRSK